jgi:hypothetical protein
MGGIEAEETIILLKMCKKTAKVVLVTILCALCLLTGPYAFTETGLWEEAEGEIRLVLSEAFYRFVAGDRETAKDYVNRAWKEHYLGVFENEVKSRISPERATSINEWFAYIVKSLDNGPLIMVSPKRRCGKTLTS